MYYILDNEISVYSRTTTETSNKKVIGSFHEVESIQKLCVLPGHYVQPIKKQMWPCVFVSMNLKIEYYPTV